MKINEALSYFKQGYLNESFCRPPISALIFTQDGMFQIYFRYFFILDTFRILFAFLLTWQKKCDFN